jgi:chromosome partitioning protein
VLFRSLIQETGVENIWLVASTPLLSQHSDHNRFTEFALRDLIETVSDAFDFIIIDTPPSINSQSTWASLLAANAVAMCVQLEPFSGHSLSRGEKLIEMARKAGNPNLQFLGYIPTLKDQRLKIHAGYEVSLRELYNTDVFETVINRLSPFVEAQHHRQTVLKYASSSSAATTVRQLGKEIQQRLMTRKAA